MICRQLFDSVSSTYTYLLANRRNGEALIIDPVIENVDHYIELIDQLGCRLLKAVDTHTHADHITGMGELRDRTRCVTVMGSKSGVDCVSMRVEEGETIDIDGLSMRVLYTPGHTDDSYSFYMDDRVFTGDTLLIRGTGRTDFQNGDPHASYDSIVNKLFRLPEETLVYPAHDYKGDTVSTIGEEIAFNPRLKGKSESEYVEIMNGLNLPNPKLMDVAVPANLKVGFKAEDPEIIESTLTTEKLIANQNDHIFVDLREESERCRDGVIPGSIHVPYIHLKEYIKPGGMLCAMCNQVEDKDVILYCAFGERSALALKELHACGIKNVKHMGGGIDAWRQAGGTIEEARQSA
ncbi:MAG: MBL fold metallo-hydrolase [Rhodospirillales bacterium]|jgi:glyoxylase-like metal-dependent hydrolase (beta-lactamase superfamily II)